MKPKNVIRDRAHENICIAIVTKAARDYKRALRRHYRSCREGDNQKHRARVDYFERWFKSDWAQLLTGNNGEYIMNRVRDEVLQEFKGA